MSEENTEKIVRFTLDPNNPPEMSEEELKRLNAMTDEEVEAAALSDPDCHPCTEEELSKFSRVADVKRIRKNLHMTQKEFAETFHLSLGTVRDWEQYRYQPDQAARTLLTVIARNPEAVMQAIRSHR